MYKDVWKRVLAVAVTICLVVTFVQWPTKVKAEETKTYHLYQHGGDGDAGIVKAHRAAAIFTVNQNEDGNAEILESATFDLHVEEGTDPGRTKATVSYYMMPEAGAPDQGKFVCSDELYGLVEGTNRIDLNGLLAEMEPGTTFAIIVTIVGEGISFYADEFSEEGRTFIAQEDGTWRDLGAEQCVLNIRAITYDVEVEEVSIVTRIRTAFSRSSAESDESGDALLVQPEMPAAENGTGQELTDGGDGGEQMPPEGGNDVPSGEEGDQTPPVDGENPGDAEQPPADGENQGNAEQPPADSGDSQAPSDPDNGDGSGAAGPGTDVPADTGTMTPGTTEPSTGMPQEPSEPGNGDMPGTDTPGDTGEPTPGTSETPTESQPGTTQAPSDPGTGDTPGTMDPGADAPADTGEPTPGTSEAPTEDTPGTTEPSTDVPSTPTETQEPEDTGDEEDPVAFGEGESEDAERPGRPQKAPGRDTTGISMDPSLMYLGVGQSRTIALTTNGGVEGVSWRSSDEAVATVSGDGTNYATVHGVKTGVATIYAEYLGETYWCDVEVIAGADDLTVTFSEGNSVLYDGEEHRPVLTVKLGERTLTPGTDYNTVISYWDPDGNEYKEESKINYTDAGAYWYQIKGIGDNSGGFSGIRPAVFTIEQKNLNHEQINCIIDRAQLLNNRPYSQYLSIEDNGRNKEKLVENKDYRVKIENDIIILTGIGNYTGERRLNEPQSLTGAEVTFAATSSESADGLVYEDGRCVYTGKPREPGVNVTVDGKVLSRGTDYTIKYTNNTNVNEKPSVIIEGMGDYYGSVTKPFSIIPKSLGDPDVSVAVSVSRTNSNQYEPTATILYRGMLLVKGTDFDITPTTVTASGTCTVTGKGNYTGSVSMNFEINDNDINTIVSGIVQIREEYTGGPQTPIVTLEYYADSPVQDLVLNRDYTVSYEKNTSAGVPRITIEGIGSYTGKKVIEDSKYFEITPVNVDSSAIEVLFEAGKNVFYSPAGDASARKPEVIFRTPVDPSGSITLAEGIDYTVEYPADLSQGTKSLTIKGQGNFTGTRVVNYTVVQCELQQAYNNGRIRVEVAHPELPYGSKPSDAGIKVYYVGEDGKDYQLRQGEKGSSDLKDDFYIEYEPEDAMRGPVQAKIQGFHNYTGALLVNLEISGTAIEDCSVNVDPSATGLVSGYQNNGLYMAMLWSDDKTSNGKLKIQVISPSGKTLVEDTDYTLKYENYTQVSKRGAYAKVRIIGKGEYFGEKTCGYLIAEPLDGSTMIELPGEAPVYTGQKVTLSGVEVRYGGWPVGGLGSTRLEEGEDYVLEYQNNINATKNLSATGRPQVRVKNMDFMSLPTKNGCFLYKDPNKSEWKEFTIEQAQLEQTTLMNTIIKEMVMGPHGVELTLPNDVFLSYNGLSLTSGIDFSEEGLDITYSNNMAVTKEGEYASAKIKGKGNFVGWKEIPFTIIPKAGQEVSSYIVGPAYYNGGRAVEPEVQVFVMENGKPTEVIKDTDYSVTFDKNYNVGAEATVTIEGIGSYEGKIYHKETFTILPRDISGAKGGEITVNGVIPESDYTSQPIIQNKVTVQFTYDKGTKNEKRVTLAEGTDYTLNYLDNVNAGTNTAYLSIAGIGNYSGIHSVQYTIKKIDIGTNTKVKVSPIETQGEKIDGTAVRPPVEILYTYNSKEDPYTLVEGVDYTLKYENNFTITNGEDNNKKAKVTITGKGNFEGTQTAYFKIGINIADPNKVTIEYDDSDKPYTGVAYEPPVTLYRMRNGRPDKPLKEGKDYTVKYENNVDAGVAIIKITGIGIYGGTVEKYFTIGKIDIEKADAQLFVMNYKTPIGDGTYSTEYTGQSITPDLRLFVGTNQKWMENEDILKEFQVIWGNNIDCGLVQFELVALNKNYTGTLNVTNTNNAAQFTITPKSIGSGEELAKGFSRDEIPAQPLERDTVGNVIPVQPSFSIYYAGDGTTGINRTLIKDTDYECYEYGRNTAITLGDRNADKAFVKVRGIGNYTGEIIIYFQIKDSINNAIVTMPDKIDFLKSANVPKKEAEIQNEIKAGLHVYQKKVDGTQGNEILADQYDISFSKYNDIPGALLVTIEPKKGCSLTGTYERYVNVWGKLDPGDTNIKVTVSTQEYTGQQVTPIPVVEFYNKTLVPTQHFTVEYGENIGPGTAGEAGGGTLTIVGRPEGCFEGSITAKFTISMLKHPFQVEGLQPAYKFRGEAIEPKAPEVTVRTLNKVLEEGKDYGLSYMDNIKAGTATIQVTGIGDYNQENYKKDEHFDIQPLDVGELIVRQGENGADNVIADEEYTGNPVYPQNLSVWYREGDKEYRMDENPNSGDVPFCTIKPLDTADNTSAGVGALILSGDGWNIIGRREITFKIVGRTLKPEEVEVLGSGFTYNGMEHRPAVKVTYDGTTLISGTDYTVSYKDNINAGTATVIVTGNGNYSGTVEKTFQIGRYNISGDAQILLPDGYDYPFMGTGGVKPAMVVQLTSNQNILVETTDYTVSYSNNTAYNGTARITITGQGNYIGTATQTFNIRPHDIAADDVIVEPIPNQGFTGYEIVPEITITCGEYGLQKNRDYELEFPDGNVNIGSVRVVIRGKNGFTNFREETFYIGYDLGNAEVVGLKKSYPYTGEKYELGTPGLGITGVKMGDLVLSPTSYKLEYAAGSNGISAGEQVLVLTGQGEYGGSVEKTFEITPKNIRDDDVTLEGFVDDMPYEENITQKIVLRWGNVTLREGEDRDYTMVCERSNRPGIWTMTLQGVGNFTGTITKNFSVDQKDISDAEVKNISSIYTYTGEPIVPEIEVLLGGRRLVEGRDYRLVGIQDNVNAGTAKIWLEGIGNYTGEREVTFQIDRKSVQNVSVSSIGTQIYTGLDIEPSVSVSDGGKGLAMGVDYSVVYADNRKPGTGSAIVTGQGNYTATKSIPFNIRPGSVTNIAVTMTTSTSITLRWSGTGVVTGFEIYRAGDDGSYVRIGRRRVLEDYTDTQLTAGKNYYYKVRAYLVTDGEVYYSEFSPVTQGRI